MIELFISAVRFPGLLPEFVGAVDNLFSCRVFHVSYSLTCFPTEQFNQRVGSISLGLWRSLSYHDKRVVGAREQFAVWDDEAVLGHGLISA